jgi:hypothetical protein
MPLLIFAGSARAQVTHIKLADFDRPTTPTAH